MTREGAVYVWLWTKQPYWKETPFLMQNEFRGSDGSFHFRQDGTVERLMEIHQIKGDNRFLSIESPSRDFEEEDYKKAQMLEAKLNYILQEE